MVVVRLELALSGLPCQEAGESTMSPNRRGVNIGEEKMVVGEKVANKVAKKRFAKKVAKNKVAKKRVAEVAETWNRTSPSVTSVRNLGNSPRVPGGHVVAGGGKSLPGLRDERGICPTQRHIMEMLSMAVVPEKRRAFRQRFAMTQGRSISSPGFLIRASYIFL